MLTKSTKKSLAIITTLMFTSSSGPMKWNGDLERLNFVNSKLFYGTCIGNYLIMVLFEVFLAARCYQVMFYPEKSERNLPLICHMLYTLSCYAIPIHLQTNTLLRWKEVPSFINSFIGFFKAFQGEHIRDKNREKKNGCERLCKIFIWLAALISLQNFVLIMRKPQSLFFLTSMLPDSVCTCSPGRVFLVLVHLHIWLSFWAQLLFYGLTQYMYAFPCLFIMKDMRRLTYDHNGSKRSGKTKSLPASFMKLYREMQILHKMFQHCYGGIFLPGHKVTMAISVVFSIYGAVKLHGNRAILMAFVAGTGLLYLSVLFRRLGKFHELSRTLLHSWQGLNHDQILKKFIRSCRLVQVTIGSYYPVTGETVMSLGAIIINAAINMLLSF